MGSNKFDEKPATETETPSTDTPLTDTPATESSTEGDAPAISEGDVTSEPAVAE